MNFYYLFIYSRFYHFNGFLYGGFSLCHTAISVTLYIRQKILSIRTTINFTMFHYPLYHERIKVTPPLCQGFVLWLSCYFRGFWCREKSGRHNEEIFIKNRKDFIYVYRSKKRKGLYETGLGVCKYLIFSLNIHPV